MTDTVGQRTCPIVPPSARLPKMSCHGASPRGVSLASLVAAGTWLQLAELLEAIAPENYKARKWGPLRRVRMGDNTYRWMCDEHARRIGR